MVTNSFNCDLVIPMPIFASQIFKSHLRRTQRFSQARLKVSRPEIQLACNFWAIFFHKSQKRENDNSELMEKLALAGWIPREGEIRLGFWNPPRHVVYAAKIWRQGWRQFKSSVFQAFAVFQPFQIVPSKAEVAASRPCLVRSCAPPFIHADLYRTRKRFRNWGLELKWFPCWLKAQQ